jgi:hypothetical protein
MALPMSAGENQRSKMPEFRGGRKAAQSRYWQTPEGKAVQARYQRTPKGKASMVRRNARRRLLYPERIPANNAVTNAVAAGILTRLPCMVCGKKAEAHHHKGYTKEHWLDVQWLCRKHHREVHKGTHERRKTN